MGEKAKYYKCALQVNSFSYAKYRGNIPQDEMEYKAECYTAEEFSGIYGVL